MRPFFSEGRSDYSQRFPTSSATTLAVTPTHIDPCAWTRFGRPCLKVPFDAPRRVTGNPSRTVETWHVP